MNMKRARKHRKRHMLPGPAGVRQQRIEILHQKSSSKSPTSSFQEDDDEDDHDGVHSNGPLHLQYKKQRHSAQRATHVQIWDAMCLSLDRILPSHLNFDDSNTNSNNASKWLRQALGGEFTLLSDLEYRPSLHIQQIVVQVDAIHPHGHLDYTVDLVDESSSISVNFRTNSTCSSNSRGHGQNHSHSLSPEIGWLGEDLVRNHPEWIKPGAVWLCHDVSIAVFKKNGSHSHNHTVSSSLEQSNQILNPNGGGGDNSRMDRMLVINEENVVFVWTEEDAKYVTHEAYIQLLERRVDVEARLRAAFEIAEVDDDHDDNHQNYDHEPSENIDVDDIEDYNYLEREEQQLRNVEELDSEIVELITHTSTPGVTNIDEQRSVGMDHPTRLDCSTTELGMQRNQKVSEATPPEQNQNSQIPVTKHVSNLSTTSSRVRNPYARNGNSQATNVTAQSAKAGTDQEEVIIVDRNQQSQSNTSQTSPSRVRNPYARRDTPPQTIDVTPQDNIMRVEEKEDLLVVDRNKNGNEKRSNATGNGVARSAGENRNPHLANGSSQNKLNMFRATYAPTRSKIETTCPQDIPSGREENTTQSNTRRSNVHNPYARRRMQTNNEERANRFSSQPQSFTPPNPPKGITTNRSTGRKGQQNLAFTSPSQRAKTVPSNIDSAGTSAISSAFSNLGHVPMTEGDIDAFDEDEDEEEEEEVTKATNNELRPNSHSAIINQEISRDTDSIQSSINNPYKRGQAVSPMGGISQKSSNDRQRDAPIETSGKEAHNKTVKVGTGTQNTVRSVVHNPYARGGTKTDDVWEDKPQTISPTQIDTPSSLLLSGHQNPPTASVFSTLDHTPVPENEIDAFDEDDEEW